MILKAEKLTEPHSNLRRVSTGKGLSILYTEV